MGIFRQFPYSNFHDMNMDEIIELVRQLADEWAQHEADWLLYRENMDQAFTDLRNYVINYFNNLDINDAISDKIDSLVQDGTMDELLQPIFTSLTTRVTALEAAITQLEPIPEGSTSADVALNNIKIDYNGYEYDSPGNAVRGQIRKVTEKLLNGNATLVTYPFKQDLINHNTITTGYLLNNSGVETQNLAGAITNYITISPGLRYLIARSINSASWANGILYDAQQNVIGTVNGQVNAFVAPYNAYYIRLNMINNDASPANNTMYNQRLFINPVLRHEYETIKQLRYGNIAAGVDNFSGLVNNVNGADRLTVSDAYRHTDLIPVIEGETYVCTPLPSTSIPTVLIYNADGTFSRSVTHIAQGTDSVKFTVQANERFIRINTGTSYTCYCRMVKNKLSGKVLAFYGDSLTWYENKAFTWGPYEGQICKNYVNYIREYYVPDTIGNAGLSGGTTLTMCNAIDNSNNFPNVDHTFIMPSSMNDDRLDVPVGSLVYDSDTYDPTTIIGALQQAIEYIYSENPEMEITMLTEPKGWTYRNDRFEMVDPKYVAAYKAVADFYGIPVIDCWSKCGFNKAQWDLYYADPTGSNNTLYIYHPNNVGWKRLSEFIINELDNLYTVTV